MKRPIKNLKPHPRQQEIYGGISKHEYIALREDIRVHGLRQPVEITPDGTIIDGHQRVRCYRDLGWDEIEVTICEDLDEDELTERFICANLVRRQLDPLARARAYKALAELKRGEAFANGNESGDFREALAQQLGGEISGRTIDRYLRLLTLPRPIQNAVSHEQLAMTKALKVASLAKDKQEKIAERIQNGDKPNTVLAEYFPASRKPKAAKTADAAEETPVDRYGMLIDFLVECLDDLDQHAPEIIGAAGTHEATAEVLQRTAAFCQRMGQLELTAKREAVQRMRSQIRLD